MLTSKEVRDSIKEIYTYWSSMGKTCFTQENLAARNIMACVGVLPKLGVSFSKDLNKQITEPNDFPYTWRAWQKLFYLGQVNMPEAPLVPTSILYNGGVVYLADMYICLSVALAAIGDPQRTPFAISNMTTPEVYYGPNKYEYYIREHYGNFLWWLNLLVMTIVSDRPNSKEDSVVVANVLSIKPNCDFLFAMAGQLAEDDLESSGLSFSFNDVPHITAQKLASAISCLVNTAICFGIDLPSLAVSRAADIYADLTDDAYWRDALNDEC